MNDTTFEVLINFRLDGGLGMEYILLGLTSEPMKKLDIKVTEELAQGLFTNQEGSQVA